MAGVQSCQSDCRAKRERILEQQQKILMDMQGSNITGIIGTLEGFLESSLFLEKQYSNNAAEGFLLKGVLWS